MLITWRRSRKNIKIEFLLEKIKLCRKSVVSTILHSKIQKKLSQVGEYGILGYDSHMLWRRLNNSLLFFIILIIIQNIKRMYRKSSWRCQEWVTGRPMLYSRWSWCLWLAVPAALLPIISNLLMCLARWDEGSCDWTPIA